MVLVTMDNRRKSVEEQNEVNAMRSGFSLDGVDIGETLNAYDHTIAKRQFLQLPTEVTIYKK
jgi:hypothetical protein